jgi:PAS domain S-box-containing protein
MMALTRELHQKAPYARGTRVDFNETESQFAVLAESLPQLVWSTRPDGYYDYFNRRWHEFTGLTPEQSFGEGWSSAVHPDDLPFVLNLWRAALEAGQPFEGEYRIRRADGAFCWMLSRAIPIRDLSGKTIRWFGTCTNIDSQKKAEEAFRFLEEQHRLALEAANLGTWQINLDEGVISMDQGACALFSIQSEGLRSIPLEDAMARVHPEDQTRFKEHMTASTGPASNGRYEIEYRIILSDGGTRWVRSNGKVRFIYEAGASRAVSLSGVVGDITQHHASEEAQQLLTRELTHRVKNLFAIANGMVSMTARTAKDPKEMANALRGRLSALSRAHELAQPLSMFNHGAGPEVGLSQLIDAVIAPYKQADDRVTISGPDVRVGSNTTTSLALVLHELATNAAKYGCLSNSDGRLAIEWTVSQDSVNVLWIETGGPSIEAHPTFEGFGSQLAQRSVAGQLGGSLTREWLAEGLRVHMIMPLDRLAG